jgi:hypothetical protein
MYHSGSSEENRNYLKYFKNGIQYRKSITEGMEES